MDNKKKRAVKSNSKTKYKPSADIEDTIKLIYQDFEFLKKNSPYTSKSEEKIFSNVLDINQKNKPDSLSSFLASAKNKNNILRNETGWTTQEMNEIERINQEAISKNKSLYDSDVLRSRILQKQKEKRMSKIPDLQKIIENSKKTKS